MLTGIPGDYDVLENVGITIRVEDTAGLYVEQSYFIDVININDPPSITMSRIPPALGKQQNQASIDFTDPDVGHSHTF